MRRFLMVWMFGLLCGSVQAAQAPNPCAPSPQIPLADVQKRLTAAEALWRRHWRPNYALVIKSRGAWDHFDFQLRVGAQPSARLTYVPVRGAGMPPLPRVKQMAAEFSRYHTVSALFASVHEIVRRTTPTRPCGVLNVVFDPLDGHPRRIVWDSAF